MGTWLSLLHLAEEAGKEPTPEAPHQVGSFGPLTPMAHVSGFGVEIGRVPKPPRGSIHVPKEGDMGTWENMPWSWVILNVPRTLSRADRSSLGCLPVLPRTVWTTWRQLGKTCVPHLPL